MQLQRRHARHVDGRGPDLGRASSSATAPTSAAAPRSWAPCPAAARDGVTHRRALPARRQRRRRHLARRRLRRRGRALRHRRHQGHASTPTGRRGQGRASSPGASGLLFRRNSRDRRGRGALARRARRSSSTPRCTPTPEPLLPMRPSQPTATGAARAAAGRARRPGARRRRSAATWASRARSRSFGSPSAARRPRRHERDARPRAGGQRGHHRGASRCSASCRPGRRRSRWPPRSRSPSCATSTYGDRDSLGLFQQRPSQGWGTEAQVTRPGLRHERVLRRPGQGRGLPDHGDHRGRAGGAALAPSPRPTPTTSRQAPGPGLGPDRLLPGGLTCRLHDADAGGTRPTRRRRARGRARHDRARRPGGR